MFADFQDNGLGNQHENKRETDYFSICKIYAMLKVENERVTNVFRRLDGKADLVNFNPFLSITRVPDDCQACNGGNRDFQKQP